MTPSTSPPAPRRAARTATIVATVLLPPLLLLLILGALAMAALQSSPSVVLPAEPDHDDVARAMALLRQQDPRRMPGGSVHELSLSQRDVELLLNHAGQRWLKSTAQLRLSRDQAELRASLHAPPNPFGRWINLRATFTQTAGLPVLQSVQIGRLPLPVAVVEPAARWLAERNGLAAEMDQAIGAVQEVGFEPQELQLRYVWRGGGESRRLLAAFVPADDQRRLRIYNDRLAAVVASVVGTDAVQTGDLFALPPPVSLAPLIGPLFELARQRTAEGADGADENRAALLVLTMLAIGRNMATVLPDAAGWTQVPRVQPTLVGRADLPQHLLVSAVIAAEGTSPLSRAVGVYKEVADSRGGTGFSFDDIAADRSGTRLGALALQDALRLQRALAGGVTEAQILPAVDDLPSNMTEPEFLRRFGGVDRPRYRTMVDQIDRRIDALEVWGRLGGTATR
ncbi:MAG: hypothetical protein ABIN96_17415 [Rubrivivax sp.]